MYPLNVLSCESMYSLSMLVILIVTNYLERLLLSPETYRQKYYSMNAIIVKVCFSEYFFFFKHRIIVQTEHEGCIFYVFSYDFQLKRFLFLSILFYFHEELCIWKYGFASYTGWPPKKRNSRFSGLCSDQQLSFFTLLDIASFLHYNNTKILKFGWDLFSLWVIIYGLSFSGFSRFPEFRGTINNSFDRP